MRGTTLVVPIGVAGLAAVTGLLAGCTASRDAYTYPSTAHLPATVALVDTRSGEALQTWEIPVGEQLRVRFLNVQAAEATGVDRVEWYIESIGGSAADKPSSAQCPPASARRLVLSYRNQPEYHKNARQRPLAPVNGVANGAPVMGAPAKPSGAPVDLSPPAPKDHPAAPDHPADHPAPQPPPEPSPDAPGEGMKPPVDIPG